MWSQTLVGEDKYKTHSEWPLNDYITRMEGIYADLSDENPANLRPSREFSVSAAVLGAITAFDRHYPTTLEDIFTLIHQNLMVSTALLTLELFSEHQIKNSPLPLLLKSTVESVHTIREGQVGTPQLIGVDVDETGITFYYNVPLRNHSGKLTVRYDRLTETISLQGQFLGQARDRWEEGRERLEILNFGNILPLQSEVKQTQQELTFSWNIKTQGHLQQALNEYKIQAIDSLGTASATERVGALINEASKDREITEFASVLLNENNNAVMAYGRRILELWLDKPHDFQTFSSAIFIKLLSSGASHPLVVGLTNSIISQIKGTDVNDLLESKSGEERAFIEQGVAPFRKDPSLIYQVPINSFTEEIWRELISQPKGVSEVLFKAQNEFVNMNDVGKSTLLRLLIGVLQSDKAVSEIFDFAHGIIQDQNAIVRLSAIRLLNEFAREGKNIPEILPLASQAVRDTSLLVKYTTIQMLGEIAKHRQGIPQIVSMAMQQIGGDSERLWRFVVTTLTDIVKQDQGIPEIMEWVQVLMRFKYRDQDVRGRVLDLLQAIADEGQGIPEILPIALQALQDQSITISYSVRSLVLSIINQDKGIPEIIEYVQLAIQDRNVDKGTILNLLAEIVKLGKGIPEILPIALKVMNDEHWFFEIRVRDLLVEIAKQDQGIPEIVAMAQQRIKNSSWLIRSSGERLLIQIAKQGKGISEIIAVAQQEFENENEEVRISVINILIAIADQSYLTPEMLSIAQKAMQDPSHAVMYQAARLNQRLQHF